MHELCGLSEYLLACVFARFHIVVIELADCYNSEFVFCIFILQDYDRSIMFLCHGIKF